LGWAIRNKDVSTCIFGASKPSQVDDNVKAVEIYHKITPEIEERIEKLLDNRPASNMDWKKWKQYPPRR